VVFCHNFVVFFIELICLIRLIRLIRLILYSAEPRTIGGAVGPILSRLRLEDWPPQLAYFFCLFPLIAVPIINPAKRSCERQDFTKRGQYARAYLAHRRGDKPRDEQQATHDDRRKRQGQLSRFLFHSFFLLLRCLWRANKPSRLCLVPRQKPSMVFCSASGGLAIAHVWAFSAVPHGLHAAWLAD